MFWHRSTKDIVISRKRKREEQAEWAATHPDSEAEPLPAATSNIEEAPIEETRTEEKTLEKPTLKKMTPRQLWIAAGSIAAAILLLVLIIPKGTPEKAGFEVPEGMSIVALQDTALAGSITAGDIVQIYASDGTVIQELRYVQVCGVTEGSGLLLAMEPVQVAAFVQHEAVTAALITQSDERAAELLELQKRILYPTVQLQLSNNITLKPGETWIPDLTVTADPEDGIIPEITWNSSDLDICTFNDGVLTVGAVGKAVLTVSCGEVNTSCNVEVCIPLTALQLNTGEASLAVGETVQLTATPEPLDATGFEAAWTSDNPAVATVTEDGTVTAVSSGTATITAACGEISASCTITIGVHTELVQLSQHDVTLAPEETLVLQYAISPADNNLDGVSFSSSDPGTISVAEDGTITALKAGQATVTITSGNASDTCTVTVTTSRVNTGTSANTE